MPKIEYQHKHNLTDDEARKRVREMIERFSKKFSVKTAWDNDNRATISGMGVTGSVDILAGQVNLLLDLSLMLAPMKKTIEETIDAEVKRALA